MDGDGRVTTDLQCFFDGVEQIRGVIESLGSGPFNVKNIDMTISARRLSHFTVTPLDENGYAAAKALTPKSNRFKLLPDVMHYVLQQK